MIYPDIYKKISNDTGIPIEVVEVAYKSFWEFIRETIKDLPLKEDLTEKEFNKLRTSFNIPSLGKLYCDYDRMVRMKKHFKKSRSND